jgi:protocatechuate 3,4-dioxygenase beta subunit
MIEAASQFARDLAASRSRRQALGLLGTAIGGTFLAACGSRANGEGPAQCLATPAETAGPFPADGTQGRGGINVLDKDGILRSDIRSSFAGLEGTAEGVPLDLEIALVGTAGGCAPLAGWAVYLWQNDARGEYSLYTLPQANYLRGLQQSGDEGTLRFRTIVPGCYGGRYPHMHFEVFSSAEAAISGEPGLLVSQFALPAAECRAVYAADERYGDSLANLERVPVTRDFVFRDASEELLALQTIALEGDGSAGFRGKATVGVAY